MPAYGYCKTETVLVLRLVKAWSQLVLWQWWT